jgi:tRNA pseudouridine38-40 synthase
MASFRLILEYDGRDFEGWQAQPGAHRTVQGTLSEGLTRIIGGAVRVTGAGRTDSGVHAEGQVASVEAETKLEPGALQRALNGVLPADLAVVEAQAVPADFDARRGALSKLYRYQVWNGPRRSPLREARALFVSKPLDLAAMRAASAQLVGVHDFASFQAAGSSVTCTVRELMRCEWLGEAGGELALECEGTGFLRHMVRNVAGTLLEVGQGRRAPESLSGLLAARDRTLAGPTAAAHALTLVRVDYPAEAPGGRD